MPVFTVQNLIDRAAAISDMHDGFVQPEQWVSWYNTERRALQIFMARHGAAMQDLVTTTANNPDVVTLTSEFVAIVGVWEVNSSGRFRQLRILDFPGNYMQGAAGPSTGKAQFVTIEDNNGDATSNVLVRFFPRDTSGAYIIVTVKAPTVAASATQSLSLPMGIEERIVLGMAKRALIKEESDVTAIKELIAEQDRLIEEFVSARALAQTMKVRNVDSVERYGWNAELLYPEISSWVWV